MHHVHPQVAFAAAAFEAYGFHEAAAGRGSVAGDLGIHMEGVQAKWTMVAVAAAEWRHFAVAVLAGEAFVPGDEVFAAHGEKTVDRGDRGQGTGVQGEKPSREGFSLL